MPSEKLSSPSRLQQKHALKYSSNKKLVQITEKETSMIGKQSSSTKWQLTVFYVSQIKVIGSTLITLFSEVPHLQWWTAQCFTHTRTHTHMHSHLPTDQTPHISSHELWVCNKYDNNLFATKTQQLLVKHIHGKVLSQSSFGTSNCFIHMK